MRSGGMLALKNVHLRTNYVRYGYRRRQQRVNRRHWWCSCGHWRCSSSNRGASTVALGTDPVLDIVIAAAAGLVISGGAFILYDQLRNTE